VLICLSIKYCILFPDRFNCYTVNIRGVKSNKNKKKKKPEPLPDTPQQQKKSDSLTESYTPLFAPLFPANQYKNKEVDDTEFFLINGGQVISIVGIESVATCRCYQCYKRERKEGRLQNKNKKRLKTYCRS
jgi:hypothetical protein